MQHEKIIKRENGDSVKIDVSISISFYHKDLQNLYSVGVAIKPKNKRIWVYIQNQDDYSWRKLNSKERQEYDMKNYLLHVTAEEILEVKRELWKLLEPK